MSETNSYVIKNVDALYPKINQTYKFDSNAGDKGKSVPCDPLVSGAEYSLQFKMVKEQAVEIYEAMNTAFLNHPKRGDDWPNKLTQPFKKDDDGMYVGKAKLKGNYNNEKTTPPKQFDSKTNVLPADFLLTTGSTVNLNVQFVPYRREGDFGVSLRLRAVQVIAYVPLEERSPFDVISDGYSLNSGETTAEELFPSADPEPVTPTKPVTVSDDVFDEPKVKKANTKTESIPKNNNDLGALLDEFDD